MKQFGIALSLVALAASSTLAIEPSDIKINTDAFIFNTIENTITASKNVHINAGDMAIQSQSATYRGDENEIHIEGNVLAKQNNAAIRTSHLIAKMDTGQIVAPNRTAFKYEQYYGEADRSNYNTKSQLLRLEGNPFVLDGSNKLRADEILFDFKTNKIKTQGRTKIRVTDTVIRE